MKNTTCLVSLVITTWNNKIKLNKCLESIVTHSDHLSTEIIVIDNASKDGTIELVNEKFPQVLLIENTQNVSAAQATNQGILRASGKYIIHLDDDIEVINSNWKKDLIDVAESDEDIGIVGCKLIFPNGKIQHAGAYIGKYRMGHYGIGEVDNGQYDFIKEVDYVCGAVFLMKRSLISNIGVWDEDFSPVYADETEFCIRARTRGYKVFYTPNPVIIHHQGTVTKNYGGQIYMVKNLWKIRLLYFPLNWLLASFLILLPREFIYGISKNVSKKYLQAYLEIIKDRNNILKKRKYLKDHSKNKIFTSSFEYIF